MNLQLAAMSSPTERALSRHIAQCVVRFAIELTHELQRRTLF